jgi:hypothetical protein
MANLQFKILRNAEYFAQAIVRRDQGTPLQHIDWGEGAVLRERERCRKFG